VSQQELDVAQVSVQTWQAQVRSAKSSLEQANLNLSWTTVDSPIDGLPASRRLRSEIL
jgi:multidrug resistance efflux pump